MMENQIEKKMEHEMETGFLQGFCRKNYQHYGILVVFKGAVSGSVCFRA